MRRLLTPILILVLFMCGCSSSSSGGSSAPASNYTGRYSTVVDTDAVGEITIVQNGGNAALSFMVWVDSLEDKKYRGETTTALIDALRGTAVGKVKGRKIDATWGTGYFTRMEFSKDGTSYSAQGDFSFAGVKLD